MVSLKKSHMLKMARKVLFFIVFIQLLSAVGAKTIASTYPLYDSKLISNSYTKSLDEYEKVVVEGRGMTKREASLNAAKKALRQAAGIYLKVRETITEEYEEANNNLIRETDRHRFNQSFYSDGLIKSFKILATRKRDGIITVTAAVTVWTDIDKKKYIHPRLRANVSVQNEPNQGKSFFVYAEGIARSEELALINAVEEALAMVSLNNIMVDNIEEYDSIKELISNAMSKSEINSYLSSEMRSATSTQGFVHSLQIISSEKKADLYFTRIKALVTPHILAAYLSNLL